MDTYFTPFVSAPFADRVVMTLHLGAHLISTAPHVSQVPPGHHASAVIEHFRRVAAAMGLQPLQKEKHYFGNAYINWVSTLAAGQAIYGIRPIAKAGGTVDIRVEFNPAKLSNFDFKLIESQILELLGLQTDFSFILPGAKVTRLDVTIDITGIALPNLIFVGRGQSGSVLRGARSIGKQESIWSDRYGIETVYFRTGAKSPTLLLRAYNKDLERLQREEILALPTTPTTRIEIELKRQQMLSELPSLMNPFSALGLCDLRSSKMLAVFADSVRMRGLEPARSMHPEDANKMWHVHKKHDAPWWNPGEAWRHWPANLLTSGFGKWVSMAS